MRGMLFACLLVVATACETAVTSGPPATPSPTPPVIQIITGSRPDRTAVTEPLSEIIPPFAEGAATVFASADTRNLLPGPHLSIEGFVLFLQVIARDGTVIVDRMIDQRVGTIQPLLAGDYTFAVYYRSCDGNCTRLDGPDPVCDTTAILAKQEAYALRVVMADSACELAGPL